MGMAASQARFLGLTARKTNVEFEGQQINQQRTTLSNQSANYYNQLLGMSVPTPPSVSDYTKTVYTFTDGALTNSISSMIAQQNGKYLISYTSSWVDDFAAVAAAPSIITEREFTNFDSEKTEKTIVEKYNNVKFEDNTLKDAEGNIIAADLIYDDETKTYKSQDGVFEFTKDPNDESASSVIKSYSNVYTLYDADGNVLTTAASKIKKDDNEKYIAHNVGAKELKPLGYVSVDSEGKYIGNDEYLNTLSAAQIQKLISEEQQQLAILNEQYGNATWMVRYVQNTTSKTWVPYFYKQEVIDSAIYSDNGASQSNVPAYTIGSAQKTEEIKGIEARLEQDSTGRIINVTLKPGEADEVTYAVTTNTITDQAAYDDAMNQYEYDKYQYDQYIQEINAKIEIIQSEDKNLELRLKQLDTEHTAIQTEMEAVSKVIEKSSESGFKTFG